MIRTQIFLTQDQHQQLKRLAHLRGQTYSSILRGYLNQALGISTQQKFLSALEKIAGTMSNKKIKTLKERIKKQRALW